MIPHFSQLGLGFVAGALTTLSPCVLPILPFVVGGAIQENRLAPLAIASGLLTSFVTLGWILAAFGSLLGLDSSVIRIIGGLALALTGLVLLIPKLQEWVTSILTPLSAKAETHLQKTSRSGLAGHFTTGLFLGAIWSPCSGPTLGSAIALAAQEGGGLASGVIMLFFGLGAVSPLIAIAYGAQKFIQNSRTRIFKGVVISKKIFGVLMLLIGLLIFFGIDKRLEAVLVELMPDSLVNLTTKF